MPTHKVRRCREWEKMATLALVPLLPTALVVPSLSAELLTRDSLRNHLQAGPIIVQGLFEAEDLSHASCLLFERTRSSQVQRQRNSGGDVSLSDVSLHELCESAYASHHDDWVMLFDELLISQQVPQLEDNLRLDHEAFEDDWFHHFPARLQPSKSCLVIGGEGARSTLHADPFEWVGTNIALEGAKLWRFLPPRFCDEPSLQAYRLPSVAWGEDGSTLSAGWQSDVDLYAIREYARAPSGEEIAHMDPDRVLDCLLGLADPATRVLWPEGELPSDVLGQIAHGVQREGDVVLLPPKWMHQTYSPGPSIGIAGQYLDSFCRRSVFNHILALSETPFSAQDIDEQLSVAEQVQTLMDLLHRA